MGASLFSFSICVVTLLATKKRFFFVALSWYLQIYNKHKYSSLYAIFTSLQRPQSRLDKKKLPVFLFLFIFKDTKKEEAR